MPTETINPSQRDRARRRRKNLNPTDLSRTGDDRRLVDTVHKAGISGGSSWKLSANSVHMGGCILIFLIRSNLNSSTQAPNQLIDEVKPLLHFRNDVLQHCSNSVPELYPSELQRREVHKESRG